MASTGRVPLRPEAGEHAAGRAARTTGLQTLAPLVVALQTPVTGHGLSQGVCHRDLKLENTLLDGRPAPRLKICDFGYSKSAVFDSQPKSTVGTPAYIAPEVRPMPD